MEQESKESSYELLKTERYLWMARAFAVVSVLSLVANVLLLVALVSLQPLTRMQPFMLNIQDKDQQVIEIERPNLAKLDMKKLEESYIRQYIVSRYTVGSDIDELKRRWGIGGIVNRMSSMGVYGAFESNESYKYLPLAENDGMTRSIVIESVNQTGNQWVVIFRTSTMQGGVSEPIVQTLKATVTVGFEPTRTTWEYRLENPLGFQIKTYKVEDAPLGR